LPNNLINADHYHGGVSKFIGFAKVQAVIKLIAGYPVAGYQTVNIATLKMLKSP